MKIENEMLDKAISDYLWKVKRGSADAFRISRDLSEGIKYKRIPKSYWNDENRFASFFEVSSCSKEDLKIIYAEIVMHIFIEIKYNKELLADHYFRLMHALVILNVSHEDDRFPESEVMNKMYELAYYLMKYDTGSEECYEKLQRIAWLAAEAVKEASN